MEKSVKSGLAGCGAVVVILALVSVFAFFDVIRGVFPFGPETTITTTVNRLYIDYSGSRDNRESHYMVGTDSGVFEVDNSLWLWQWNADEIYSSLQEGKRFEITIKGREWVGFFFQDYRGITNVKKVE